MQSGEPEPGRSECDRVQFLLGVRDYLDGRPPASLDQQPERRSGWYEAQWLDSRRLLYRAVSRGRGRC